MWISIALVVLLIFADLFSEKILVNGVVCFLAAGCGAAMMAMWLEVYSELEKQTSGGGVEHGGPARAPGSRAIDATRPKRGVRTSRRVAPSHACAGVPHFGRRE